LAGITGIFAPGKKKEVEKMLNKISHRGLKGKAILELKEATLGVVWPALYEPSLARWKKEKMVKDDRGTDHFALARVREKEPELKRDYIGVAPLYYIFNERGDLCFSSEVKGLLSYGRKIKEMPPGSFFYKEKVNPYFRWKKLPLFRGELRIVAQKLRDKLSKAVKKRIKSNPAGSLLSGGLDSSVVASLARPRVQKMYTFSVGVEDAPDLYYAREMAKFIGSEHREIVVDLEGMLEVLPKVIYHLESFDAPLVRSSIINYMVANLASDYVPEVFSGEGGDELFAGYDYLKSLNKDRLPQELRDITFSLHNTALQRVDRCASAHGIVAQVPFLDQEIVDYAFQIPVDLKIKNGVEKWILRKAVEDLLPEEILWREKSKFWQGAGVEELLYQYAEENITDEDFGKERVLPNGWVLRSKEELMYYRIFRDFFGELQDLSWMGRTKVKE